MSSVKKTLELIKLERQADLEYYRQKVLLRSLHQRTQDGTTWYPLRLKRDYRYHFVLKSPSREKMNATLRAMLAYATSHRIPRTQLIVDVDALWLM